MHRAVKLSKWRALSKVAESDLHIFKTDLPMLWSDSDLRETEAHKTKARTPPF